MRAGSINSESSISLPKEVKDLISQFAISRSRHGGRRKPYRVFTEYGAVRVAMS